MVAQRAPEPVGAGGRLSAAFAEMQRREAQRLSDKLYAANLKGYHATMKRTAKAFGAPAPKAITSTASLAALKARALTSATSIVATETAARARFIQEAGNIAGGHDLFRSWQKDRAPAIASFEAGMAAGAAAQDFRERNADAVRGTATVVPPDTDSSDICADLIARGSINIDDIDTDLPAHFRCPHAWQYEYTLSNDSQNSAELWLGQDRGEVDGE